MCFCAQLVCSALHVWVLTWRLTAGALYHLCTQLAVITIGRWLKPEEDGDFDLTGDEEKFIVHVVQVSKYGGRLPEELHKLLTSDAVRPPPPSLP